MKAYLVAILHSLGWLATIAMFIVHSAKEKTEGCTYHPIYPITCVEVSLKDKRKLAKIAISIMYEVNVLNSIQGLVCNQKRGNVLCFQTVSRIIA